MGGGGTRLDGTLVGLLDRLGRAALVVDPARRTVLHGNPAFCALGGFAPADLPTLDLAHLHDLRDLEWIFQAAGAVPAPAPAARRVSCLGKGGTPFVAELRATRLGDGAGNLVLLEYEPPAVESPERTLSDHRLRSSLLTGFTGRLTAAWDRDALGRVASEAASGLLGAERMLILLRRAGVGGTEVLVSDGIDGEALAATQRKLDDLLLGGLLPSGRPTVVTVEDPPALVAAGVRSLAVYGLEWDGRSMAAWALGYPDPEAAAESYLDLGQTFAAHLSGALSGTLLLERTRKEKSHQEVLNRILTSLRGATDLDAVLQALSAELRRALEADRCAILVSEEKDGEATSLRVEFEDVGPGVPPLGRGGPIPFGGTALGAAILYSKDVMAVEDFALRPDLSEDQETLVQRLDARGFIAAKILARGEFQGLVAAVTRGLARAWAADEIDLVRAIADHVSITLRTRDLVRANVERARQLDLLSRVQHAAATVREEDALRSESGVTGLAATIARGAAEAVAATYPSLGVRVTGIEGAAGEIGAGPTRGAGTLEALELPIRRGKRTLGALQLRYAAGAIGAGDRATLGLLADRLAVTLENAALFSQIERERREWERTFDAIPDMLSVHDDCGRLLRANVAFQVRLAADPREYAGRSCTEVLEKVVGRPVSCPHEEAARERRPTGREIQGENGIFALTAIPCFDAGGRLLYVIHVCREITQEKQIREQLLQSEKMAAVGSLISGVAHELNNPLAGVTGFAQLLLERQREPNLRRTVERIRDEADRAARIVKNLLTFARKHKPETAMTDINGVIERTLELRAYDLRVNKIKVLTDLAKGVPRTLADPNQLQQVFLNVITNAEQAMREAHGGGTLRIASALSEGRIRVTIGDDGPGIRPEHLSQIFDPFFTTKPVGKGTGLGLSICHGIVKEHNGTIGAASVPGKGTTFTIDLPVVQGREAPVELRRPLPKPPAIATILVVDDEEAIRELTRDVLRARGHTVDAVESVAKALEAIGSRKYDLIVSDLKMPETSGQEFFARLQADRADLAARVMFISGDTVSPDTQAFLDRAGRPYLLKPFKVDEMVELVERLASAG